MHIRRFRLSAMVLAGVLGAAGPVRGGERSLLAWWGFEDTAKGSTLERVSHVRDTVEGHFRLAAGVRGRALKCDGFTTCARRKAADAPRPGEAFTIQAWVAVQAYPWGWCPIVSQRAGQGAGYRLAIDARGRVGMQLAVDGQWQACVSEAVVPLMAWAHVAGTFDGASGMTLYINGVRAGHLAVSGSPTYAADVDLLIGRNPTKEPAMFTSAWGAPEQAVYFAFDGLIDEVKIDGRCLSGEEIGEAYSAARPSAPAGLAPRRMPSGPKDVRRFGAFYHHLRYCEAWDSIWRGSGPDVVVGFDFAPVRLVFWRGISYAPCWVTEKGNWFSNEFMERGVDRKTRGCSESMSDKRAYYSHAKILETSDARAVVYWRNAPVGVHYEFAYVDAETGWGDWSEEYHTIYPDGVAVRKVVMWSSNFDAWHEWCQSIVPLHAGQRPEDVLDAERILSVANMQGETKRFGRESGKKSYRYPTIPGANIQIVYLDSRFNPFLVLDDRAGKNDRGGNGPAIVRASGEGWSEHSAFPWGNHWPVTQVPLLERHPQAADRPSHTWTSTQYSAAYETTGATMTKIMLCGLTDQPIEALLPLARSWLRPPVLTVVSGGFAGEGYDPTERAYRVRCGTPGEPATLSFRIEGSAESPIVNPAIVVRDWGERDVTLVMDGASVGRGEAFRCGQRRRLDGTDLVAWIRLRSDSPVRMELAPRPTER